MTNWSGEIKELEKLYESFNGHLPDIEKEIRPLIQTQDANVAMLYSRRCLEVIITDLCETELNRPRKTEPLKGIIDKLNSEEKVPSHIIASMQGLNSLSTYGAHPKDFDPEQVKPVINNLVIIIRWYLRHKNFQIIKGTNAEGEKFKNTRYSSKAEADSDSVGFNDGEKAENTFTHKNQIGGKIPAGTEGSGKKDPEYSNDFKTVDIVTQFATMTMVYIPGKLEIINGKDAGKEFVLAAYPTPAGATVSIGSREESGDRRYSHIRLLEKTVSRAQAELIFKEKKLMIKNLSRTNFTQLDGVDLQPDELGEVFPESIIRMGEIVFKYHC